MSDATDDLLVKVEDALWMGDQRTAGILLHKVLLQDFTNRQAWLLLQQLRGGGGSLEEFQQRFARRYYPQLAHLLDVPPTPSPEKAEASPTPPEPSPQLPSAQVVDAQPESPTPAPPSLEPGCPGCGAEIPLGAEVCPYCRVPVILPIIPASAPATAEPEPASPEPQPATPEPEPALPEPQPVAPEPEPLSAAASSPVPVPTRFCPVCGTAFIPQAKFCNHCGAPVPGNIEAASAGAEILTPETGPVPSQLELLPEELDLLLKRSASSSAAPAAPEAQPPLAQPLPAPAMAPPHSPFPAPVRKPYCPTCHKTFSPKDLFCDTCGAPLLQMVEELPEELQPGIPDASAEYAAPAADAPADAMVTSAEAELLTAEPASPAALPPVEAEQVTPQDEDTPPAAPRFAAKKRRLPRGCALALWILLSAIVLVAIGVGLYLALT